MPPAPLLDDQPAEWATVLHQLRDLADARALFSMFEYRDDTLFANDLPIDALVTGAALLSERGLADFLAGYLAAVDPTVAWRYTDIYVEGRGDPSLPALADQLVARCKDAGVVLAHRPSPPSPWRVVLAQVTSEADAAALRVLIDAYVANSWWWELETELALPALPDRAPTAAELADLIARCRQAGVVLREA